MPWGRGSCCISWVSNSGGSWGNIPGLKKHRDHTERLQGKPTLFNFEVQHPTTSLSPFIFSSHSFLPPSSFSSLGSLIGHVAPYGTEKRRSLGRLISFPPWPPCGKCKASCWLEMHARQVGGCTAFWGLPGFVVWPRCALHGRYCGGGGGVGWLSGVVMSLGLGSDFERGSQSLKSIPGKTVK